MNEPRPTTITLTFESEDGAESLELTYHVLATDFANRWALAVQRIIDAQDELKSLDYGSDQSCIQITYEPYYERFHFKDGDLDLFDSREEPGRAYLFNTALGGSLIESFEKDRRHSPELLRSFSAGFYLYFGEERRFEKWPALARWLFDRGYDLADPGLTLGSIAVAELAEPPQDFTELRKRLARCPRIVGLKLQRRPKPVGEPLRRHRPELLPPEKVVIAVLTLTLKDATGHPLPLRFRIHEGPVARKWLMRLREQLNKQSRALEQRFDFETSLEGRLNIDFDGDLGVELENDDYAYFTPDVQRGGIYLSYGAVGLPTLYAFLQKSTQPPQPQRKLTAGFSIFMDRDRTFGPSDEIHRWLRETHGAVENDLQWAVGQIPLGEIILSKGQSLDEVAELIRAHHVVAEIKLTEMLAEPVRRRHVRPASVNRSLET